MIISRSPFRIPICGGGTDLHSYYSKFGSTFVSAAIDQYLYISLSQTYQEELVLRYSKIERVKSFDQIHHPIIREAFKLMEVDGLNFELTSIADQSAGTGLGSSSSFTTAVLKALSKLKKKNLSPHELAELACHVEIDLLKEPIGKQDQYIAAFGGVSVFQIDTSGNVSVCPLKISDTDLDALEDNLVMFSTGTYRAASSVLKEQDQKSKENDQSMIDNLHVVQEIGMRSIEALESGNLTEYGKLLNTHWEHKKKRSKNMTNPDIDRWCKVGLENGALGMKLNGAGGGGFIMFYTEEKSRLVRAMKEEGLRQLKVKFDFEGTKII